MLRIGKLADYGLLVSTFLSKTRGQATTEEIVNGTGIHLATVRKLLKFLVDAELVVSKRGLRGGYHLGRDPQTISVAEVIQAVEGPIALTECCKEDCYCELAEGCSLNSNWGHINRLITDQLSAISIDDMSHQQQRATEKTDSPF